MRKRILTCIMMLIMSISLFPVSVSAIDAETNVKARLDAFIANYPSGSSWTKTFDGGGECYGFAKLVIYNIFGKYSSNRYRSWLYNGTSTSGMNKVESVTDYSDSSIKAVLSKAKCGDVLQFDDTSSGNGQHSMIIYSVEDDGVVIYDCNRENYCEVKLEKVSYDYWTGNKSPKLTLLRSDNYAAIGDASSSSNTSNVNLRVQYWVSEKGKGWTAEQATEATQFQTGKTYYFWYKIYDAISGKYLNELFPSLDYDVQMTLSGPNGTSGSCSYAKSDCNWYGITVTDAGTYTCEVTVSGGITGSFQAGFSAAAAGIKKPTVYMDKSSVSLTPGETATCTVGVIPYDAATINYGSENSNICEVSVGEVTSNQKLISIPLKITGLAPGKTNVKLHFLNSSGNTLATSTISVTVKSGINASPQIMPPVFIYGDGDWIVQTDESEQNTGAANVMGTTGYTLKIGEQSGVEEETTEAPATGSGESNLMVMVSPEPTTPTTSDGSSENQFSDVRKSDYFYESVRWAVNNKVTTGTTKTTFSPTVECTNAHFITFLWRAAGYPDPKTTISLTDVSEHDYFYKAAMWALEKGLIFAYSDGGFHPNQPISRSDLVTVLWRYAGSPDVESTTPFTDVQSSMPYAKAVKWAVDNNVTTGTSSTTFSPNTICNRAQIVTFLYRYFG